MFLDSGFSNLDFSNLEICYVIILMIPIWFICKNKMLILKNTMYFCIIKFIDFYSYLKANLMKQLPLFIFIKTFTYRSFLNESVYEFDFDITEYKCNLNQRFYTVRFIDTGNLDYKKDCMYNFIENIDKRIEDRNLIFHSSIQKDGEFIKDVTEELRSFFHYVPLEHNCSSKEFIYKLQSSNVWKYIKINIGFDEEYQILVSLNDSNLTDLLIV